jgi:predicted nucleotidyltransferase
MKKTAPLTKDIILDFLRTQKPLLKKKFGVTKIALFGSYARNEAKKSSDIDLLIEVTKKSFNNTYALKEYLEKHFNKKVDIGYFDCVRTYVFHHIQEDLIYA